MTKLDTEPPVLGLVTGGPITLFTQDVALPLHLGNKQTAALLVMDFLQKERPPKMTEDVAIAVLQTFLQYLLDQQRYVDAATLLWPPNLFSGNPRNVKRLWDAIFQNVAVMVPGAASMGKSYNVGVWCYLDWRRDPNYTNILIAGPSEGHLERNLFSHLAKLHKNCSIPGPGELIQLGITLDPVSRDSGIFGIVAPTGKKAPGRLQGVKVLARPHPHPQFGPLTRLRVVLEEAENIPVGLFEDVTNVMANTRGKERFKIIAPFNPKDPNSSCAVRCEPVEGWASLDLETSEQWDSKRGWKVIRLDAYKSENVQSNQEIFFGMQTREGLDALIRNAGGVGTPGYYTMARGWWPPSGVDLAVIPQHLVNDIFGYYEFTSTPVSVAGVDVALEGGDNAIFALGKFGEASGWRKPDKDGKKGDFIPFKDAHGSLIRREVLQVEQLFPLPKGDTLKLVDEISRVCRGAYVSGKHLGIDRAGNGAGVHDLLVSANATHGAIGINGSHSPTERKILEEDTQLPCDEYSYLISELWFAARKFIEFGLVKISPNVPSDPLISELTGRRFLLSGRKIKVESKKEYKSRGNKSPDRADAITNLVHICRMSMNTSPSATGAMGVEERFGDYEARIGITDRHDSL
jgi:hypothetical protein